MGKLKELFDKYSEQIAGATLYSMLLSAVYVLGVCFYQNYICPKLTGMEIFLMIFDLVSLNFMNC